MALPVTVQLLSEETMLSFASRLAAVNGVGRLSNLCGHLGLDLKALVHGDESQIQRLAAYGGVDARELMNRTFLPSDDGLVWFRSERLALSAIHRRRVRACPECLCQDRARGLGLASRPLWALVQARRCCYHGLQLVDASPFVPNDFSATWQEHFVPGAAVSGDPLFEIWARDRLEERIGDAWIDKLDIDVVGECAEMIGVSLLFGKNRGVKSCSPKELANAVSTGFAVLKDGPDAVLSFFEALRYGQGADQDRPQARYGRIHEWLKRGGGSSSRFEPVRAILRNHIMITWPLDRNDLALDEKVIERRFHSLQSAAKELDLHPKRLGKRLEAEGHLDLSKSGPDRLIPVWVITALRDGGIDDAGLGEATEMLGVSKFTIDTLVDAGVLCRATSSEGLRPRLDRASVLAFSSWIRALPESDGHTGRDIRAICRLFRMTAPDVLRMALDGKLPGTCRLMGRVDYHAIRILPEDVETASDGQLRPMLDLYGAARSLSIDVQFVEKITAAGLLVTIQRSPRVGIGAIPMIPEEEVNDFRRKYVIVGTKELVAVDGGLDVPIPIISDGHAAVFSVADWQSRGIDHTRPG